MSWLRSSKKSAFHRSDELKAIMDDTGLMRRAYHLAMKAKGQTSPNPLVGCVLVKGREVIAEGWHRRCGADHAEVMALKKVGKRARGAKMVVTLEPCYHYGRTPPCVDKIIESGIKEVAIGMKDPNPLTNGRSIAKLRRAGIKVKSGILQDELRLMNEAFIKHVTKRMPFVAVKSAQSLDGKIATSKGESKWITSETALKYARRVRDEYDAILVGINTVLKDNPRLTGSKKAKRLKKIILDSTLRISPKARLFFGVKSGEVILATTDKAPRTRRERFLKSGVHVVVCPRRKGRIDIKGLFKELARMGIASILVEGGAHVVGSVLKEKLADKFYWYIAPVIMGDQKALPSVVGLDAKMLNRSVRGKGIVTKNLGRDILVEGYLDY